MAKVSKKAEENAKKPAKKVVTKADKPKVKKQQTVRERTLSSEKTTRRRLKKTAGRVTSPLKKISGSSKRQYTLPLPDNRAGRVLNKRVRLAPKFMREAWHELRLVTWPNARETYRLTIAVFVFAVIFAAIVGVLDYGLDKLFREVIIK